MEEFLWLIPMVVLHELGHYIGFRIVGFKPSVKFTWWGILIGNNCFHMMRPLQAYIAIVLGIGFGLIPGLFFKISNLVIATYIIMSCVDITHIMSFIGLKKEEAKMTLYELNLKQLKELKQQYGLKQ